MPLGKIQRVKDSCSSHTKALRQRLQTIQEISWLMGETSELSHLFHYALGDTIGTFSDTLLILYLSNSPFEVLLATYS